MLGQTPSSNCSAGRGCSLATNFGCRRRPSANLIHGSAKSHPELLSFARGSSDFQIASSPRFFLRTNHLDLPFHNSDESGEAHEEGGCSSHWWERKYAKKKAVHKTPTTDGKRLQSTLRRIGVNTIPAIEEVNIFKDDVVIQFLNPKVQASIAANTRVVSGSPQTKNPDTLENSRRIAQQFRKQASGSTAAASGDVKVEDDDDVPELVPGETFEAAAEEKKASW